MTFFSSRMVLIKKCHIGPPLSCVPYSFRAFCVSANQQFNVNSIIAELININKISSPTSDDRGLGKKYLAQLSSALRENSSMKFTSGDVAVAVAQSLANFDSEGAFKSILEYLEICIWGTGAEQWSTKEVLDFLGFIRLLDTTAVGCVLVALINPLIRLIPTLSCSQLSFVVHVVSSFGIRHYAFSKAISARAHALISEMSLDDLCQILTSLENAEELSGLIDSLFSQIDRSLDTVSPRTLAQCYAVVHMANTQGLTNAESINARNTILEKMHIRLGVCIHEASLDDVVELLHRVNMVQTKAQFTETVNVTLPRFLHFKNNLLPEHIVSLLTSLHRHQVVHEDMLGAIAERACRVVALFQPEQMALVLKVLSSFELYDPELYPLLALRVQHMTRQKIVIDSEYVVEMLAAFARMSEKNEPLLYSSVAQLKVGMPTIATDVAKKALDAFRALNFNHQDIIAALESRIVTGGAPQ